MRKIVKPWESLELISGIFSWAATYESTVAWCKECIDFKNNVQAFLLFERRDYFISRRT